MAWRNVRLIGVALVAVLVGAVPAWGQEAEEEEMQMGLPPITAAQMERYADVAGLTAEQRDLVRALHADYLKAVRESAREVAQAWKRAQEVWEGAEDLTPQEMDQRQRQAMELTEAAMGAMQRQFRRARELEEGLMSDVRALLTPEQEPRWVRVERMRRRDLLMAEGMPMSWAQADLVAALAEAEVPVAGGELADLVERYEVEVDRVLEPMLTLAFDMQEEMSDAMDMDMERMQEVMERVVDWSRSLRRLNKDYARRLGVLLGEQERARFEERVRRRAFPEVYGDWGAGEAIEVALGFSDLDGDQRAAIERLKESYAKEAASANTRWAEALERRDDAATAESILSWEWEEDEGVAEAERARRELDRAFRERLESVLRPEQRERLPQPPGEEQELILPGPGGG